MWFLESWDSCKSWEFPRVSENLGNYYEVKNWEKSQDLRKSWENSQSWEKTQDSTKAHEYHFSVVALHSSVRPNLQF